MIWPRGFNYVDKSNPLHCPLCIMFWWFRSLSVLYYRLTPSNKAEIVRVAKKVLHGKVLAVGDGANDVPMIQRADVGIGISGHEGMQVIPFLVTYVFLRFCFSYSSVRPSLPTSVLINCRPEADLGDVSLWPWNPHFQFYPKIPSFCLNTNPIGLLLQTHVFDSCPCLPIFLPSKSFIFGSSSAKTNDVHHPLVSPAICYQ